MMEYKKTRKQEDKTNVLQAGTVAVLSSKSNVLYSRNPVFSYSKTSVFSSSPKNKRYGQQKF